MIRSVRSPRPPLVRRLAFVLALATVPGVAFAYVDPNAGGLLYQILFPVIVAVGAAWAGLRHRVGAWWSRLRGRQQDPGSDSDHASRAD